MRIKCALQALLICSLLTSCGGGGGGGGEFIGAAEVSVDAQPTELDPGNLMRVLVDIYHPHTRGIMLKIRFPRELRYVNNTSLLDVDSLDDPLFIEPSSKITTDKERYLVFTIGHGEFDGSDHAKLKFDLEALSESKDKSIEVDADIDTGKDFDADKANFEAQDEIFYQIID